MSYRTHSAVEAHYNNNVHYVILTYVEESKDITSEEKSQVIRVRDTELNGRTIIIIAKETYYATETLSKVNFNTSQAIELCTETVDICYTKKCDWDDWLR